MSIAKKRRKNAYDKLVCHKFLYKFLSRMRNVYESEHGSILYHVTEMPCRYWFERSMSFNADETIVAAAAKSSSPSSAMFLVRETWTV